MILDLFEASIGLAPRYISGSTQLERPVIEKHHYKYQKLAHHRKSASRTAAVNKISTVEVEGLCNDTLPIEGFRNAFWVCSALTKPSMQAKEQHLLFYQKFEGVEL